MPLTFRLRNTFLGLKMPLLDPPPFFQSQPTVATSVTASPFDPELTRQVVDACEAERAQRRQRMRGSGRAEQGGHRITEPWLRSLKEADCVEKFRMNADEIMDMVRALELPEEIRTKSHWCFTNVEALCLTLARYGTGGNQSVLTQNYMRPQPAVSEIFTWVVTFIDETWKHLLDFDEEQLLSKENLERYAQAVHEAGAPLEGIWGFIDCTIRRICRPSQFQRQAYNGYKKYHALKFQAIMLPNGLFGHLFGPQEGRRADTFMFNDSEIREKSALHAVRPGTDEHTPDKRRYLQLFGDPAYGVNFQILSPYSGEGERTEGEQMFNVTMASMRIEVEHGFAVVLNLFPYLNSFWRMRIHSSPIGSQYRVGILLSNGLNCLRPSQVSQFFNCPPPDLFEYFHH